MPNDVDDDLTNEPLTSASVAADQDEAPDAVPQATTGGGSRGAAEWLRAHLAVIVVGAVIVALAAALVVTTVKLRRDNAVTTAQSSASAAARVYAVELASYDYQHLAADFAAVERNGTPSFVTSYKKSSASLESLLSRYHASASAKVVATGVTSATSSHADILIFVNQTVTNSTQKSGPTTDQSRLRMTLVHQGGQWRIDKVQLL